MKTEQKRKYGDYQLLGEMLNCSSDAAKMRYLRGDKQAVEAMQAIRESRTKLIETYKK